MAIRKLLDITSLPTFVNEFLSELVKYLLKKGSYLITSEWKVRLSNILPLDGVQAKIS